MNVTQEVIVGDSDKILPQFIAEGRKFDLILTDPPYNLNKDFGNDSDSLPLAEFLEVSRDRIQNCRDLLTNEGSLLWFGIHHYIGFLQAIMYEAGLHYRRMNIWRYNNGFSRSKRVPRGEYEPFLWFTNSDRRWTYNTDDVRIPYRSEERLKTPVWYRNSKGERVKWAPDPRGAMRGDIWEFPTLAGKRFAKERTSHPTQKPVALFVELLKAYCPKDSEGRYVGAVLDPFLGSGTTAVACEILNSEGHKIKWVGIELEERWATIALDRVDRLVQQQRLL
ncbi:DNA-methyltransferase [Brevibacterium yomogidense]|uniref:DNA-methyltransferase n=1 Tax=Brevibacterium yomogidense TaxID=946573 RepID=UPI000B35A3BE|nr:site-specific DNA-methyltransferase [Brevibacterium yomogidense]